MQAHRAVYRHMHRPTIVDIYFDICVDICVDICIHMCMDMCTDMCLHTCTNTHIGMQPCTRLNTGLSSFLKKTSAHITTQVTLLGAGGNDGAEFLRHSSSGVKVQRN